MTEPTPEESNATEGDDPTAASAELVAQSTPR